MRAWAFTAIALGAAACNSDEPSVTREEACRNVATVCRNRFTEMDCLRDSDGLAVPESQWLCLANADFCDEVWTCGLPGFYSDAGTGDGRGAAPADGGDTEQAEGGGRDASVGGPD